MDLIERQDAICTVGFYSLHSGNKLLFADRMLRELPSAQPEWNNCEGCKHLGMWENEVEYGYPSPCTRCKRRASDNYER